MGQFRASQCPICASGDNGKWTCPRCTRLVEIHRALICNLQSWRSLYEQQEVSDVLVAADGNTYCLWDVDHFYGQRTFLAQRMQDAIVLCLYENKLERDAAVEMGISPNNPVRIYATIGLTHMIARAVEGEMPGYTIHLEQHEGALL